MGSISQPWVQELSSSFSSGGYSDKKHARDTPDVQLIWPSVNFVKNCINGYSAGGSLCFPQANLKPFMKDMFYEYKPSKGRQIVPPHIKTYTRLVCTEKTKKSHASEPAKKKLKTETNESQTEPKKYDIELAWVILSSANLSKAAWGALQKNNTQLMIRHYEAGVLFLPDSEVTKKTVQEESVSEHTFPLPYSVPVTEKNPNPWIWNVPYTEEDILGEVWSPE
jgi:tyrosyl-DNA phosphodiesterase-1